MQRTTFFLLFSLLTTSCSLLDPVVYKIPIQQGNIIDAEQVDKLQIGMTKDQVAFVLGSPMVTDAFNDDYWEYLYLLTSSDGSKLTKNLRVTFKDDLLSAFEGNFKEDKKKEVEKTTEEDNAKSTP